MESPERDALAMVTCSTGVKSLSGLLCSCLPGVLMFCFVAVGAVPCRAQDQQDQKSQDVAEAARQERARKQAQQKKPKHVYTADDLKHQHILTPEDQAAVEARKNQPAAIPGTQEPRDANADSAVASDSNAAPLPSNAPLGDVARRLRRQKESQQLQRSAQFPLPFSDAPVLASPKTPVQPLRPPVVVVKPVAPPAPAPFHPFVMRSPFERPRNLPSAPAAPRTLVPSPLAPRVLPAPPRTLRMPGIPPPPRLAPSTTISGKLTMVTVKPGDSLWKFAASRLGDGHRWQELLALNPGLRNPDLLDVGSQIVVPASLASPRAPTKYTVRQGDTLWTIAQSHFGHGSSWSCIAQANSDLADANLIHEGQILLLPASCPR
jgi:nucleoid-associated protein YgaU